MTERFNKRHHFQRVSTNADEVEFRALHEGGANISDGVADDRMAGQLDIERDEERLPEEERWQGEVAELDGGASDILDEVKKRAKLLGEAYPFLLRGNALMPKIESNLQYEFLLAASITKKLSHAPFNKIPWTFEHLSAGLVAAQFGQHARWQCTGAASADTTLKFREVFAAINTATGEWIWQPNQGYDIAGPRGDEKVDYVVWSPFDDGRTGALFVIGQCACGDNWSNKTRELNYNRLTKWFSLAALQEAPVRSFSTCFVLSDGNIIDHTPDAGIIFDRIRLMNCTKYISSDRSSEFQGVMKECVSTVAADLKYDPKYPVETWV
jgi:hypothetical protein